MGKNMNEKQFKLKGPYKGNLLGKIDIKLLHEL